MNPPDDVFWQAWPCIAHWRMGMQCEHFIRKWRSRRLLQAVWRGWVEEAAIFRPALVNSSDSEPDISGHQPGFEADSSDESEEDDIFLRLQQFNWEGLLPTRHR